MPRRNAQLPKPTLERMAVLLRDSAMSPRDKSAVVQFLYNACHNGGMNPAFRLDKFLLMAGFGAPGWPELGIPRDTESR